MNEVNDKNFGLLAAYLLPGLLALWSLSGYSPLLQTWLGSDAPQSPTIGGFLYVTLASLALGLIVSALRWLILDGIHHRMGVPQPAWDFSRLQRNQAAFEGIVQNHYRYYQFYGNSLIALLLAIIANRWLHAALCSHPVLGFCATLALAALLFVASRDALGKYYSRTTMLLTESPQTGGA